jgi:hypothetical protein
MKVIATNEKIRPVVREVNEGGRRCRRWTAPGRAISVSPPTSRAAMNDRRLLTSELSRASEAITVAMRLIGT